MEHRAPKTLYWIEKLHQIQNCTYAWKCFRYRPLYTKCRHFLAKYRTHDLLPANYRTILYVAPNNRIARTYQKHNTRPSPNHWYKQHSPYQIQNYCIASIHQIQNNGGKQHTYYTSYQIQKNAYYYTKYRKTDTKYRSRYTARTLHHHKCPYRYRNLHRVVIIANVCWFSAVPWLCVCGMNGMLSLGCIVFDQDRPVIACVNPLRHWIGSLPR